MPTTPSSRPSVRTGAPRPARRTSRLRSRIARHLASASKFLVVGGTVFLIDTALYNLLVFWEPWTGWGRGIMFATPLWAKIATIAFASCLTYLGNRLWTFSDRPAPRTARSVLVFALVNLVAAGLQLGCLAFSRYVLGLTSPLADNVSGNLIGQAVSTAFRFVAYGRLVFPSATSRDAGTCPNRDPS